MKISFSLFEKKEKPPFKVGALVTNDKKVIVIVSAIFKSKRRGWVFFGDKYLWDRKTEIAKYCVQYPCSDFEAIEN